MSDIEEKRDRLAKETHGSRWTYASLSAFAQAAIDNQILNDKVRTEGLEGRHVALANSEGLEIRIANLEKELQFKQGIIDDLWEELGDLKEEMGRSKR